MEKLTDAEIIKALECCHTTGCYEDCPCYDFKKGECEGFDHTDLLNFINRKDAEIERLKAEIRNTDNILNSLDRPLIEVKSEAYKEFAEKAKEEITKTLWRVITDLKYEGNKLFLRGLIFENIDNLLKELTEGCK